MNNISSTPSRTSVANIGNRQFNQELYLIIAKFLENGPCKKAYEVLRSEIEDNGLIPERVDWTGKSHDRPYHEYEFLHPHISSSHLPDLLSQLSFAVNGLRPLPFAAPNSLLGYGKLSLLRCSKGPQNPYPTMGRVLATLRPGIQGLASPRGVLTPPNVARLLKARLFSGHFSKRHLFNNNFYSNRFQLHKRTVGHLSSVYCVLFDRTGRYIFTGSDDTLVKIWSVRDGRLLATLRGASGEISDIAIDPENTMVAAGSCDKIIRVWSLQTLSPVAVLQSHTGMVTAVQFCPSPDTEDGQGVLVSTGGDGCVAFWTYVREGPYKINFRRKPLKFNERVRPGHAQLICCSFSAGGTLLALGGVDHHVRVYRFGGTDGLEKVVEKAVHQDCVDSIQWSHGSLMFASGSRDGKALIWRYYSQEWQTTQLDMTATLGGASTSSAPNHEASATTSTTTSSSSNRSTTTTTTITTTTQKKVQVTMVGWSRDDIFLVTCSSDQRVRVWEAATGRLVRLLQGHTDDAYVIEAHPTNPRIVLTAGHDGQLIVWDIVSGTLVFSFKNSIEGQGHGALFDAKWSPDGQHIATTDSHGHISIYGMGSNQLHKKVPQELFFHTDYRPLARDAQQFVLDEQTQMAPHLMPPPFLVNMDGNPYPPLLQRLVPGRENCDHTMLVPNVIFNANGDREVFDVPAVLGPNPLPNPVEPQVEVDVDNSPPLPPPPLRLPLPPPPVPVAEAPLISPLIVRPPSVSPGLMSPPVRLPSSSPRSSVSRPPDSPGFMSPAEEERPRLVDQMIERLVQEQQQQINRSFGSTEDDAQPSVAPPQSSPSLEEGPSSAPTSAPIVPFGSPSSTLSVTSGGGRPSAYPDQNRAALSSSSASLPSENSASLPSGSAATFSNNNQASTSDGSGPSTSRGPPAPIAGERRSSTSGPDHSYAVVEQNQATSPRASRGGARLVGDVEGVRQSVGDWQREPHGVVWTPRRALVPTLPLSELDWSRERRQLRADQEERHYLLESAKPPLKTEQLRGTPQQGGSEDGARQAQRRARQRRLQTRARQRQQEGNGGASARSPRSSGDENRAPHGNSSAADQSPEFVPRGAGGERSRVGPRRAQQQSTRRSNREVGRGRYGTDYEDPNAVASQDSSASDRHHSHSEGRSNDDSSSESSSGQSTDYSDWTAEQGVNLEPPKRTVHRQKKSPSSRRQRRRRGADSEEGDHLNTSAELTAPERVSTRKRRRNPRYLQEEGEGGVGLEGDSAPGTAAEPPSLPARQRREVRERVNNLNESSDSEPEEIPDAFRPPEWLTETQPKRAPYFPQMGDQLMFFMQGHMLYVDAVIKRKLYPIDVKALPWNRPNSNLRECEYVKIIGIKYEIRPPRLCCLKLGIMDSNTGRLSTDAFTLKYHDIPDVLDFLVLKQTYDVSSVRQWTVGERFRCIIDDAWWMGTVKKHDPNLDRYPESKFMCYTVTWDNGETERLSPWDMEPVDDTVDTGDDVAGIPVRPDELEHLRYSWTAEDWQGGRDGALECERLANGLGLVMGLAVAEPFLAPVDLSTYPNYALIIEYPMDLSTIKSRLENGFYRRLNAVQFDVRYIATNAEKFNQRGSNIVRQARIVTELCLDLIKNPLCRDPTARYHEIASTYHSPNASDLDTPGPSGAASASSAADNRRRGGRTVGNRRGSSVSMVPWPLQCKEVLRTVFEREDSMPFRYPVDLDQYPDYSHVVEVPMDLSSVREELATESYQSPQQFAADIRLIFANSKNYNTNKKSKIYSMTVRMEAFFEDKMKAVIASYEAQQREAKKPNRRSSGKSNHSGSSTVFDSHEGPTAVAGPSRGSGPSTLGHTLRASMRGGSSSSGFGSGGSCVSGGPLTLSPTTVRIRRLATSALATDAILAAKRTKGRLGQASGVQQTGSVSSDDEEQEENDDDDDLDSSGNRRSKRVAKLKRLQSSDDSDDEDYSPSAKKASGDGASNRSRRRGAALSTSRGGIVSGGSSGSGEGGNGMAVRSRVAVQYQEDSLSDSDNDTRIGRRLGHGAACNGLSREGRGDQELLIRAVPPPLLPTTHGASTVTAVSPAASLVKRVVIKLNFAQDNAGEGSETTNSTSADVSENIAGCDDGGNNENDDTNEDSESESSSESLPNERNVKRKLLVESDSEEDVVKSDNRLSSVNDSGAACDHANNGANVNSRSQSSDSESNDKKNDTRGDSESDSASQKLKRRKVQDKSSSDRSSVSDSSSSSSSDNKRQPVRQRNGIFDKKKIIPNIGRKMPIYKQSLIPRVEKRKKKEDSSEFECDNESVSSESSEEESTKGKKVGRRKGPPLKRSRRSVLDGDDLLEDEDFVIDDDEFIDNEGASDDSDSSSTSSRDSDDSTSSPLKKKKKKKHTKGIVKSSSASGKKIPLVYKPGSGSKRGRGGSNNKKNRPKKGRRKGDSDGPSYSGRVGSPTNPRPRSVKRRRLEDQWSTGLAGAGVQEVRDGEQVIGTVYYSSNTDDSDDMYTPTAALQRSASASKSGRGGGKRRSAAPTSAGGFKRAMDVLQEPRPQQQDDDEEEERAREEVRKSNRSQRKVHYDEADEDEDDLNVSSRGRVRRANTLMKDFI